jgi:hypothetical protein
LGIDEEEEVLSGETAGENGRWIWNRVDTTALNAMLGAGRKEGVTIQ